MGKLCIPTVGAGRKILALGLLCLLLYPCIPAHAAPKAVGNWRVELPAGWKAQEEGNQALFSTRKEDCFVTVLEKDCVNGELDTLARASANITGGHELHSLGEGKGIVYADRGARFWIGLADDKYMEVSVGHTCQKVEPMLNSLKAVPNTARAASLEKLLAIMRSPENVGWLANGDSPDDVRIVEPAAPTGDMPDFAAMGDHAVTPPAPQEKTIPEGWRTTQKGGWTIYDRPDEKVWLAVGIFQRKEDPEGPWGASLIELARKLGGINITTGEGTVDFITRGGGMGTMQNIDATTVVEIYFPEEDDNLAQLREALN